jgi:hypothetical protein
MSSLKPESTAPLAVIAGEDADYERLNLARDAVAPWEDGARTDNRRGTYEWWYFDAHLDDRSSLVVVFMNKDLAKPSDPLTPTIRLDLDLADGPQLPEARHVHAGHLACRYRPRRCPDRGQPLHW